MSRPSDEDLAHEQTQRATDDSFRDVDGLDPAIGDFVRELGRGPGTADRPTGPVLTPGTRIDEHLEIVRKLGAGGMGVVYLAHDVHLDRSIAVKLVGAARSEDAAARLQREAQAMARLAHPNVVAVHEVGTYAGAVYVAMEYVDGGTARHWLEQRPRRWDEILDVYLQAARGLAAAHCAGFVHRDFKPDNVLVGGDGRVRVADFGLARSWLTDTGAIVPAPPTDSAERSFERTTLTASDAVVGTPGYMAPEQFGQNEVGPAADQFAFGVAMYEALYGARPYGTHAGLPIEMLVVRAAPPDRDVPSWLRRVLVRTIAPLPQHRFADMQAVVHALERGRTRRTRRRLAAFAVGGAVLTAAVGLGIGVALQDEPCADISASAEAVWNDARGASIAAIVGDLDGQRGPPAWASLQSEITAWVANWSQAREAACRATRVEGTRSDVLLDRAFACFDARLQSVDAWLRLLESADVEVVRAIGKSDILPPFAVCSDPTWLLAQLDRPSDPATVDRVQELTTQLVELQLRNQFGESTRVRDELDAMRGAIDALGDQALLARWLGQRGDVAVHLGDYDTAERDLHEGYMLARTIGDDAAAALAASSLAHLDGVERRRFDRARLWLDHLRIDLARGIAEPSLAARVEKIEGLIAEAEGRYADSIAHKQRAVEIADAQLGPISRLEARLELASALDVAGRHREAIELFESLAAEAEALRGPDSWFMQILQTNLGLAYYEAGRNAEAIELLDAALQSRTRTHGADSVDLWSFELNLGLALGAAERFAEADTHLRRARTRVERLGPDFVADRALVVSSLAWIAERQGHNEDALAIYRESLRLQGAALPADHPHRALEHTRTAEILVRLDRLDEAERELAQANEIWAKSEDTPPAWIAETWFVAAKLERDRGHIRAAVDRLAQILALAETAELPADILEAARRLHGELTAE